MTHGSLQGQFYATIQLLPKFVIALEVTASVCSITKKQTSNIAHTASICFVCLLKYNVVAAT